jgi:hypothetical protein
MLYTPLGARLGFVWRPPFRASAPVVAFFFFSNVFLAVAPLVPPAPGQSVYIALPYWLHVVVGIGILALGAVYWVLWTRVLPRVGRYQLVRRDEVQDDGVSRSVFVKVPLREQD